MILQELGWLRAGGSKLCPLLKKTALQWYRPVRLVPCFLQKLVRFIKKRVVRIPVIVQMEKTRDGCPPFQTVAKTTGCRIKRELPLTWIRKVTTQNIV